MVKKLFAAMILAFALVVAGQTNAKAGEVYMGNYSDGTAVYLLTHTVSIQSGYHFGFTCRVRAGGDYLDYSFFNNHERHQPYYRNSEGYEGWVFDGSSPVAAAIYRYVKNNY